METRAIPHSQGAGALRRLETRGPSQGPCASCPTRKRGARSARRRPFRPPIARWTYGPGRRRQGPGGEPGVGERALLSPP